MANIALDIKANTSKALGEFKKLSRELDNKFLVQGLKLDVVKNAFRQINREFEQSLGSQGIKASQSTGDIQRNAAANLSLLTDMTVGMTQKLTKSTKDSLEKLQAEGKITGEVVREALNLQGVLKFDTGDFATQSKKLTEDLAVLGQNLNIAFGDNRAFEALSDVASGKIKIDDLSNLDFGAGGAGARNLVLRAIAQAGGAASFESTNAAERTRAIRSVADTLLSDPKIKALKNAGAEAKAFELALLELTGVFSPQGLFGVLRTITDASGNVAKLDPFKGGPPVDKTVLQLSAKLISTLFDQNDGLFAKLLETLGEVFEFNTKNVIKPIMMGAELLIGVFETLTEFVQSPAFRNFLGVFKPFVDAIKGIEMPEKITAEDINNGVDKIFGGIRGLLSNLNTYIANVDTKVISDIVGNFLGQIIETLPDLITVVFTSIGKAIDFIIELLNSDGVKGADIGSVLASVANGIGNLIFKTFELIGAALPKIVGAALNGAGKLDGGGKLLLGGAIAEGLTRLFTGKGILGNLGEQLSKGRSNLASTLNPFSRGGGGGTRQNNIAARGNEQQRWGRLYTYLENILRALNGQGPLDQDFDRDRRRNRSRRSSRRGRDGRTANQRARSISRIRRSRNITGFASRIPGLRQLRSAQLARNFLGGGKPGALTAPRVPLKPLGTGPRPATLASPTATLRPAAAPRFTAPSIPRPIAVNPSIARGSRALADISKRGPVARGRQALADISKRGPVARGTGLGIRNPVQRALIGTRSSDVASRFASRYGTKAILSRGAGRLGGGLLQGALTVGALATIFGGGRAMAKDIDKDDSLTSEEKEYYKAENQKRTRENAGRAVVGAGVGILGGAIGSAFGPAGTVIGGMLGSLAGEIVADWLPAPILEGVGKLAEDIGSWFGKAWDGIKGGWVSATASIGDFFGKEGPIQRFGRFAGDNVKGGVENIQKFFGKEGPIASVGNFFKELPGKVAETIQKASESIFDGISGAVDGFSTFVLRKVGLNELADKIEEGDRRPPTPHFAGGFSVLGGRTSFNEYEAIGMPDGVTYIPITSSTSLDGIMGGSSRGETTNNLEVTVNVTGSDPQAIATEVIAEIDKIYQSVNT